MNPITPTVREIDADKAREDAARSLKEIGADASGFDWWDRVQLWVLRQFMETAGSIQDAPVLWTIAAVIVLAIVFFVLRQRWSTSATDKTKTSEFAGSAGLTLDQLEEKASQAEQNNNHHDAVLWWFRTAAKLAAEKKLVTDLRGMTATEVAAAVSQKLPTAAPQAQQAADVFNRVMYGESDANATDVDTVRTTHQTLRELTATKETVKLTK